MINTMLNEKKVALQNLLTIVRANQAEKDLDMYLDSYCSINGQDDVKTFLKDMLAIIESDTIEVNASDYRGLVRYISNRWISRK